MGKSGSEWARVGENENESEQEGVGGKGGERVRVVHNGGRQWWRASG